jgi:hypothetical protein
MRLSVVLGRLLVVHALRTSGTLLCSAIEPTSSGDWVVVLHYSLSPQRLAGRDGDIEKIPLTDVCNRLTKRAFANRSIPDRAAFAERVVCGSEVIQGRNATPDDLAVIRASGGRAVDAAVQLRANHAQRYLLTEGRAPHRAMLPCRGVLNRKRGCVI